MRDIRYIISEASKKVEVEQHTLRYWEEELDLSIPRNEMGHRYYREQDIEVFKAIKILKERGYQLRAIKMLLPDIQKLNSIEKEITEENCLTSLPIPRTVMEEEDSILMEKSAEKMEQFKTIMNRLVAEALRDNNEVLAESVSDTVSSSVIKEMDYLLRIKEEREEERFKQFDRTLRDFQSARGEYAAAKAGRKKLKRSFFQKSR